jgi:tetratricopeptide (TPR) repeat protein
LHNLGRVAQEQRQWPAAERYYKEALQIKIDFNDRYEQAGTLGQLGLLAEAQEDWEQAIAYILQAASIFAGYEDPQLAIALRALARLRQTSGQAQIAGQLAEALGISVAESEALLAQFEAAD